MGVTSAFSFGHGVGIVIGAVASWLGTTCPIDYVHPTKWKGDSGCTADKIQTMKRALSPKHGGLLTSGQWGKQNLAPLLKPRKKKFKPPYTLSNFHEGKVEAALIALWLLNSLRGA